MEPPADPGAEPCVSQKALWAGFAVEGGLGALAAAIAWFAGIDLAAEIRLSARSIAWGLAGTAPMLVVLAVLTHVNWRPIARIREIVRSFARQLLLRASWLEVAILCALAGIGEELLFRGVLQTLLIGWTNQPMGILLCGIAFGAVHCLTMTYFILAVAVGCFLGWLYVATNSLAAPIIAHGVYDFVALAIVLRSVQRAEGD
jgi:membrane protease YdiL (CAAX protease family)